MSSRSLLLVALGLVVVVVGGLVVWQWRTSRDDATIDTHKALDALPHKKLSSADFSHLDTSILAPTNSWISGAILQKTPQPVYPLPLAIQPRANGLGFSVPKVTTSVGSVAAPFTPELTVTIGGARGYTLTRFDGTSADLTYADYGTMTIAEGSPVIWYTAKQAQTLTIGGAFAHAQHDSQMAQVTIGDTKAVLAIDGKGSLKGDTLRLKEADTVAFAIVPRAMSTDLVKAAAAHPITSVKTAYSTQGSQQLTTFTYHTVGGEAPLVGALPYQTTQTGGKSQGSLDSLYGSLTLRQTNTIRTTAPTISARQSLPLKKLTSAQRTRLAHDLQQDLPTIKLDATTSYEAGKQLYRTANLLDIAYQLNDQTTARRIQTQLVPALERWLKQGFYYDTAIHGIAPTVDNFGAHDFNDHHFHYGYFIYAASIVGAHDPTFLKTYRSSVDVLVADIASPSTNQFFPARRVFDAYAGHSWASGLAPFADGNNQESSSEATNAWNAVTLWGNLTHNASLSKTGAWLLANETQSAQRIWLTPPDDSSYRSPLVAINWGGKRVYSTWFSDEPAAKLAIQLIPLNPSQQTTLAKNPLIRQLVAAGIPDGNYNVPLGDYALMYSSLYDQQGALQKSDSQQRAFIDSANSRTYMQAWIMSAR